MPYVKDSTPSWWLLVLTGHADAADAIRRRYGRAAEASYLRSLEGA